MKGQLARRTVLPLVVILALAGLYGLAMTVHPVSIAAGRPAAPQRSIPVSAVQRGCPGLGLPGGSSGRVALVAAVPGGASGQAQVMPLAAAGRVSPHLTVTHPNELSASEVRPAAGKAPAVSGGQAATVSTAKLPGGVVVSATGAMARGLDVEQAGKTGIPSAACGSPGTDFWFVGPGHRSAARIQLYLMNTGDQAADVTVQIATDAGPLQGSTDTGVAVAPHSMVVQSLTSVVSGSRVVSLHVRTSVGQVVAAVHESTGATGGGWLPVAQAPTTQLVVPGLPASSGTRRLFLTVPGQSDAHVVIKAVTTRGTYEPTGGGGIDVPGSSAVSVDLPSMSGIPAALLLKSSQPVTASVMASGGPAGAPGAFTAAADPLQEQGVLAVNLAAGGRSSSVVLSAPQRPADVRVSELGGGAAKTVRIGAGRTTVVQLASVHGTAHTGFPVVITPQPGSGPVYAGRVILDGGSVAALTPVASALTVVPLPQVRAAALTSRP